MKKRSKKKIISKVQLLNANELFAWYCKLRLLFYLLCSCLLYYAFLLEFSAQFSPGNWAIAQKLISQWATADKAKPAHWGLCRNANSEERRAAAPPRGGHRETKGHIFANVKDKVHTITQIIGLQVIIFTCTIVLLQFVSFSHKFKMLFAIKEVLFDYGILTQIWFHSLPVVL